MLNILCVALLLLSALPGSSKSESEIFPTLNGETLSGKKIVLPGESEVPTLIVIGFSRASQQQTLGWGKCMRELKARQLQFTYRPIAELEAVPRLVRGLATRNIHNSVPAELQDNFVLLFEGEKTLKQLTHFDRSEEAYVILIDTKADIAWQDHGPCTDARTAALQEKLKK